MGDADVVHHVRVPPGAAAPEPATPIRAVGHAVSGKPSLAADFSDAERVHLAVQVGAADPDVWLVPADRLDAEAPHSALGSAGQRPFMPTVAAGSDGGGAVVWYQNVSGLRNSVHIARLARHGRFYDVEGDASALPTTTAAPYPLTLIHLGAHRYFVAWSEGQSPELYLRGQIVDLE
jgi:hypothetical protein